jgi:hypothetical protein
MAARLHPGGEPRLVGGGYQWCRIGTWAMARLAVPKLLCAAILGRLGPMFTRAIQHD